MIPKGFECLKFVDFSASSYECTLSLSVLITDLISTLITKMTLVSMPLIPLN